MEDVRKAIEKANSRFSELVRMGDATSLSELYTENACVLPPNLEMIQGRKAIKEFWGGAISGLGLKDAVLTTVETIGEGDTVTEVGKYLLKIQQGQKSMEDKGKYAVVWKKTPDGWRLHRDIWNTSLPPP